MSRLKEIGLRCETDKATFHGYLDYYEKYLAKNHKKILEIGAYRGDSLQMWKEYYPDSIVEGWDNDLSKIRYLRSRFILKHIDQCSREQVISNNTKDYDLIIDDGCHYPEGIELCFSILFPYCKQYILEDLHMTERTFHSILSQWTSLYSTKEEMEYIRTYAKIEDYYCVPKRSITVIVNNTQNYV